MAVVATLTKGYDLDYIWRQVDRSLAKDAAGYYIQASESGGEPPGRWWGPGAQGARPRARPDSRARTVRPAVRRAQGTGRHPARQAAGQRAERRRHLRPPAGRRTARHRRTPARTADRSHPPGPAKPAVLRPRPCRCPSRSRSSTPRSARTPAWPARPATRQATPTGPAWSPRSTP